MSIKDGIKFGIGFVLGQALVYAVAKAGADYCEKALEKLNKESEEADGDKSAE